MATFFNTCAPPGVAAYGVVDAAAARFAPRPAAQAARLTWVWRLDNAGALAGHWHRSNAAPAAQTCATCAKAA